MESDYVIWTKATVPGACALTGMTDFEEDWKLVYGVPVADEFPAKARFAMDPDTPRDMALTDNLFNIDMLIVASQRLRDLIESRRPAKVEYLPVPIINHKKRPVVEPYWIVHPVDPVDCLALDACEPQWGRINKKAIERVGHLVIDPQRIPADRLLFRPKLFNKVILVHRGLAEAIDTAGMNGVRWVELTDYPKPG